MAFTFKLVNKSKAMLVETDKFIVSYPKSGNTWLRFVIANILKYEKDASINFHNALDYVPDLEAHPEIVSRQPHPRIIKSHSLFNSDFRRIAYLVRDPRDVYVSYFHYLRNRLREEEKVFSVFLRKRDIFPSRWHDHVRSWVDQTHEGFRLFRYEDILNDTFRQMKEIVSFLEIDVTDSILEKAIRQSSFEEMSKIEDVSGRPFKSDRDRRLSAKFVRKGIVGDWVEHFSEADLKFLKKECGDIAARVGYNL